MGKPPFPFLPVPPPGAEGDNRQERRSRYRFRNPARFTPHEHMG